MKKYKSELAGFVCFLLTVSFNVGLGILVYSQIATKSRLYVSLIILLIIILSALLCTLIDVIRRKIMIEKPLKEILEATERMARGNFNVNLTPSHSYENYDEFDLIKDDLNKMAKELSKNEMLKSDFISNVSHEIKTPLSVISGYVKILENDSLDKKTQKKYLISLKEAVKKISDLITNILRLNKLENQKLNPSFNKFNLSESLTNQILLYEDLIELKEIQLECNIEENVYINSEESYLELIWNNLISNAIKFTDNKGTIKISLKKMNDSYIVEVKDSGCGIPSSVGKHIFDKFYQGDTSHSSEGNGLGLALVKKVIDVLGGTINVESEVGVGTTFTVIVKEG